MLPRELIRKVRKLEIVTRRLVNQYLAGQYHSVFKGRGMDFDEVRLYQPGDEVRLIDWNVSARTGDMYVKRFVEERELSVYLLVDASASLGFGTIAQRKCEIAAEIGALLAFSAIKNNDQVALIVFTDQVELFVPLKKGRRHVMRIISELLRFEARSSGTNIAAALDFLGRISRRRGVAFLLSDFLGEGYQRALHAMSKRHDLIPVVITDPLEHTMPDMGIVYFEDPESGDYYPIDTGSARVRRRFQRLIEERQNQRERAFRRSDLDFVAIRSHEPYLTPIVNYFRLRAARR
ncbi:MAG: DUF58 domain-containing protein [Myxococcota bacterium]|jgi:uncharacterized protein (DUF58 family)|nr:DUF58 domain-containing protein [Myxococcota bacterium]